MIPEPKANSSPLVWVIAVPSPLHRLFEYLPPDGEAFNPACGARVRISFSGRDVIGVFLDSRLSRLPNPSTLKRVTSVIDVAASLLLHEQSALLQWLSDYYLIPPGEAYLLGLSNTERKGNLQWEPPLDHVVLREGGDPLATIPKRARRQRDAIALIGNNSVSIADLSEQGISTSVIRSLLSLSLVEKVPSPPISRHAKWASPDLTEEQKRVSIELISKLNHFRAHLLEGITGSGKTEVYLECIKAVIANNQQVLVIIPEIGLTPQTKARFEDALGCEVPLIHSGITESDRGRSWALARSGLAPVILGTRSAVFCSLRSLGLIVVDEEHDPSLKQQDHPRYSARDVAIKRAQLCNCPIILGSATPSLESIANCDAGKYQHHILSERPQGTSLPSISLVDTRGLALASGLSDQAITEITRALSRDEQALLFINRRGFAHSLQCEDCGWVAGCHQWDSSLSVHRNPPHLSCHHCQTKRSTPRQCEECQSIRLSGRGVGTEQLELLMHRLFSDMPVFRIDSDSIKNVDALTSTLDSISAAGSAVLLGTQMLSKGHNFPKVTCVVVVDADNLLFSPDFRAEERLLQLLVQVAGRAGRARLPGKVLIQTRCPDHPLIQEGANKAYSAQARRLLARREELSLPPKGAMGVIRCDASAETNAIDFLDSLKKQLPSSSHARLLGPMPTLMTRRAGMYRYQIIIHGPTRREVHVVMKKAIEMGSQQKLARKVSWFVEIDPTETL